MHDLALHSPAGVDADGARGLFGLSLCSGAGGLDLGIMLAEPGYRAVGYVERDAFAASVLVARMEEETLDQAPVWNDVATFDGRPWRGVVDCLSGGYPCQPFSIAGKRRGTKDPRHLWPHIARIIGECKPEWVFLENVANHINIGYREVRGELESLGFRVEEGLFTAAEVGAPHRRQRLFVLAHAECGRRRQSTGSFDPQGQPLRPPQRQEGASGSGSGGEDVADAHGQRRPEAERRKTQVIGSEHQSKSWATPNARDGKGSPGPSWPGQSSLPRQANCWSTPTARDWRSGKMGPGALKRNSRPLNEQAIYQPFLQGRETPMAGSNILQTNLRLNPLFVEVLMGWPLGWTDVRVGGNVLNTAWTGFGSVATEWSRWLLRMRGELLKLDSIRLETEIQ